MSILVVCGILIHQSKSVNCILRTLSCVITEWWIKTYYGIVRTHQHRGKQLTGKGPKGIFLQWWDVPVSWTGLYIGAFYHMWPILWFFKRFKIKIMPLEIFKVYLSALLHNYKKGRTLLGTQVYSMISLL